MSMSMAQDKMGNPAGSSGSQVWTPAGNETARQRTRQPASLLIRLNGR